MQSKSRTPTNSLADSAIIGKMKPRISDPPTVTDVQALPPQKFEIGKRPHIAYATVDSFPLRAGQFDLRAILAIEASEEILAIPDVEPIFCFVPVPGEGHYGHNIVRPAILYWKDEFWIPVYWMEPERESIATEVYGGDVLERFLFDVLVSADVADIPKADLLKLRTADKMAWES
jgi:hypothetical protein